MLRSSALPVMLGMAMLACGQRQALVRSESPATVVGVGTEDVHGPYVPAGAQLQVTLQTDLSASGSVTGEPFVAVADSALAGAGGGVLVVPGARVLGHVVSATAGSPPQIVLDFDTVHTVLGPSPLVATVVDVEQARAPTAAVERGLLSSPSSPLPPEGVPITSRLAGGSDVVLPAGTHLVLELTRPVFAPGTLVGHP
jgi:hypothetical protein